MSWSPNTTCYWCGSRFYTKLEDQRMCMLCRRECGSGDFRLPDFERFPSLPPNTPSVYVGREFGRSMLVASVLTLRRALGKNPAELFTLEERIALADQHEAWLITTGGAA